MEQQFNQLVASRTVVCKPGAALRVEVLHLTEAGRKALTANTSRPLPGATPPRRSLLQRVLGL
jgi:hypothetical protein